GRGRVDPVHRQARAALPRRPVPRHGRARAGQQRPRPQRVPPPRHGEGRHVGGGRRAGRPRRRRPAVILTDLEGTCGDPPGALCRWVFDRTESDALAGVADFLVDTPLQIALILVLAWVINRLVSRGITRLVTGLR